MQVSNEGGTIELRERCLCASGEKWHVSSFRQNPHLPAARAPRSFIFRNPHLKLYLKQTHGTNGGNGNEMGRMERTVTGKPKGAPSMEAHPGFSGPIASPTHDQEAKGQTPAVHSLRLPKCRRPRPHLPQWNLRFHQHRGGQSNPIGQRGVNILERSRPGIQTHNGSFIVCLPYIFTTLTRSAPHRVSTPHAPAPLRTVS